FVDWIETGFPRDMRVMDWAGANMSGGIARMRDTDIVESAVRMLALPLPMPDDLSEKVRDYLSGVPIPLDNSAVGMEDDDSERMTWDGAIWDLKHALAWRQEHEPSEESS